MKRKALGRGLSALIPDGNGQSSARRSSASAGGDFFVCPIEQIQPQKGQPRRYFDDEALSELASSLAQHGVVQPLVVRPSGRGSYTLIAGERRWRAAQRAGLQEVPVVIRDVSANQAFEMALVENIQRADLNPIEEAQAYDRLLTEHSYTQEQLATRVGKDRSTIANALRLLKLPEGAQTALISGQITSGHARALLALEKPRSMQRVLKEILRRGLSVRDAERLVRNERQAPQASPQRAPSTGRQSANVRDMQERLSRALQTRVKLSHDAKNNGGKIEIHYASLDELDRLLEVLFK